MRIQKNDREMRSLILKALKNNEVLVLPTDTIYGFSGKIETTKDKILKIKGRTEEKPFIVLIEKIDDVKKFSDFIIPKAILAFWPGSLTIILPLKNSRETIALRCPGDSWLRELIAELGSPLFSTSCNRSGLPALTDIDAIEKEFGKEVSLIVEEKIETSNLPSTIISFENEKVKILREGSVKIPDFLL